jgi:thiosulfate/3-mercaptopyruvate sulfurtransferase
MTDGSDPLITTGELAAGLTRCKIVDGSWHLPGAGRDARAEFEAARLPEAVFFDIDAVADRTTDLPHMLPSPELFAQAVGALGIGADDPVVVYDSVGLFSAPRVWWTFRVMGHRDVRVLEGGLPRWRAAGLPISAGRPCPVPVRYEPRPRPELVRNLNQVRAMLGAGEAQVLDARPAPRFRGEAPEPRPGLRLGHMPGAINLPFPEVLDGQGGLRLDAELRRAVEAAGVDLGRPITASCGSGVTAAIVLLALARLGRTDAALYDGSWAEWAGREDTLVEQSP